MDGIGESNRRMIERCFGRAGTVPLDADAEFRLRHDDYVMEMPQSWDQDETRPDLARHPVPRAAFLPPEWREEFVGPIS